MLTIATGAYRSAPEWGARRSLDFFDLKGVVERALDELGLPHVDAQPVEHSLFRAGRAAALTLTGRRGQEPVLLGALGEVAPRVRRRGRRCGGRGAARPRARGARGRLRLPAAAAVPGVDVRRRRARFRRRTRRRRSRRSSRGARARPSARCGGSTSTRARASPRGRRASRSRSRSATRAGRCLPRTPETPGARDRRADARGVEGAHGVRGRGGFPRA